ncbi:MAG TPA: hypothetical protein VGJ78_05030 [Vicinamibacterales bacterium]
MMLVIVLDLLAVALLLLARAILRTGGMAFTVASLRVSLGSPHRALLALFIVVVVRLIVARRIGPFGLWSDRWQRLLDATAREPFVLESTAGAWRRALLASLGIGAALVVLLHDQIFHLDWVPDLGDPLFSIWRIGWVAHRIVTDPLHLFDANIFYPERLTLTLSDPVILPALTIAPLIALGVHPVVAYNILLLSGFWLSGVATYLLVERLTGSARAAFIAGLTYACYSYRFEHYSHLELQMTQWMPLGLLALHLFLATGRRLHALAFGLAGVAQLYSSMYYAAFFLVYATVIGIALLRVHRLSIRPLARPLALAAVIAAVLAVPITWAFVAAEPMKGARGTYEVEFYSAYPSDYVRANKYSALWSGRLAPPAPERTLFPGAAPVSLAALAIAPPFGTLRLIYAGGLLASVDGTLGLHGVAYPYYYWLLPPFRGLRAPSRFAALVGLTLAILAGFGARRALRWRAASAYQHAMFAGLIAFVMVDAWPSLQLEPVWKEPPPIYDAFRYTPNAVLVETPLPNDEIFNIPYLYFSTWHFAKMVNGYSGFTPQSYADFYKEMELFPDSRSIAALRQRGVTYVTVNCGVGTFLSPLECGVLMNAVRHDIRLRLTSSVQWNGHTVQLYEVLPPP